MPLDAVVVGAGEVEGGLAGDEGLCVGPGGEEGEEEDSQHADTESLRQTLTHHGGSQVWCVLLGQWLYCSSCDVHGWEGLS